MAKRAVSLLLSTELYLAETKSKSVILTRAMPGRYACDKRSIFKVSVLNKLFVWQSQKGYIYIYIKRNTVDTEEESEAWKWCKLTGRGTESLGQMPTKLWLLDSLPETQPPEPQLLSNTRIHLFWKIKPKRSHSSDPYYS